MMGANLGPEFHPHPYHTFREKPVVLAKLVPPNSPHLPTSLRNTLQRLGSPLEEVLFVEQAPILGILVREGRGKGCHTGIA